MIKNKEYKKRYYSMVKQICMIEQRMRNDRCPSQWLGRNCCGGCNLLKEKILKIKKEQMEAGEENIN